MSDQDAIIILLGALLSVGAMLLAVAIVISILTIVAHWKMFTKAGVEGWKSIIPIYSDYVLYKIVWNTKSFLESHIFLMPCHVVMFLRMFTNRSPIVFYQ